MNREYNEAMDDLRFSPGAKERMAAHLAAAREQARSERPQPDVYAARGGKRRWRFAAAAAVTLVLAGGLAGGAYASGALMGVGNVMDDLFGGPPAQTEVVDKIGRPLGASATSNGVTVTAEAIIGDRANYTIVFSIAKDDGTPFEDIEALDNGLLPLGFGEAAGVHVDGVTTSGGSSHFYDADPSDNAIQYVEQMSVTSTSGSIIGHTARVCFQDLYRYGDGGREVLVEGTWNMKFVVDYEDTSVDLPAGQPFELNGMGATLDSASISPIALTLEYTADGRMDWIEKESGRMSEREAGERDRFLNPSITVNMKDGTVLEIDASQHSGGSREDGSTTVCHKNIVFEEFLNTDEVASVTIGGTEIALP